MAVDPQKKAWESLRSNLDYQHAFSKWEEAQREHFRFTDSYLIKNETPRLNSQGKKAALILSERTGIAIEVTETVILDRLQDKIEQAVLDIAKAAGNLYPFLYLGVSLVPYDPTLDYEQLEKFLRSLKMWKWFIHTFDASCVALRDINPGGTLVLEVNPACNMERIRDLVTTYVELGRKVGKRQEDTPRRGRSPKPVPFEVDSIIRKKISDGFTLNQIASIPEVDEGLPVASEKKSSKLHFLKLRYGDLYRLHKSIR